MNNATPETSIGAWIIRIYWEFGRELFPEDKYLVTQTINDSDFSIIL